MWRTARASARVPKWIIKAADPMAGDANSLLGRLGQREKRVIAVSTRAVAQSVSQPVSAPLTCPRAPFGTLQAVLLVGGGAGLRVLRSELLRARVEQQQLCTGLEGNTRRMRAPRVAVDAVFAKRLRKILAM